MGTRGFVGFVADRKVSIVYNHYDSYPSHLGVNVLNWLNWLKELSEFEAVKILAANLREVSDDIPPTPEQIEALKQYYEPNVAGNMGVQPNWYQALRNTQGDPGAILASGLYESAADFPYDSLFCEWGYLIDLDAMVLEVYRGFQHEPHTLGRFADNGKVRESGSGEYYPVALKASWPLDDLPTTEAFEHALKSADSE